MTDVVLVEATDAFTNVAVRGRLDAAGVGEVELKLGIGMLVAIARSLRLHGAGVAVVAGPPVSGILEMMHIGALIPVVATREDALRALGLA